MWSGAGVGVGMLKGVGDSPTYEILSWFLVVLFLGVRFQSLFGFSVPEFHGCWFQSFLVSKRQGFVVSTFQNIFNVFLEEKHRKL